MKTLEDIQSTVRAEITHFRFRHKDNSTTKAFLWYYPTTSERDGGILVAEKRPLGRKWLLVEYEALRPSLSVDDIVKSLTLRRILGQLPVLSLVE